MQKQAHFHRSLIIALLLNIAQTDQSFKCINTVKADRQ